jgi:hypothetical protein
VFNDVSALIALTLSSFIDELKEAVAEAITLSRLVSPTILSDVSELILLSSEFSAVSALKISALKAAALFDTSVEMSDAKE